MGFLRKYLSLCISCVWMMLNVLLFTSLHYSNHHWEFCNEFENKHKFLSLVTTDSPPLSVVQWTRFSWFHILVSLPSLWTKVGFGSTPKKPMMHSKEGLWRPFSFNKLIHQVLFLYLFIGLMSNFTLFTSLFILNKIYFMHLDFTSCMT